MKTTAIANWYGSNRILAETVGVQLGKCEWVGIPFCGACCELPYIKTRSGIANDLHRHLINLCRVVRDQAMKGELAQRLESTLFHPDELAGAQRRCRAVEEVFDRINGSGLFNGGEPIDACEASVSWAFDYFLCSWMTAGGRTGTKGEFKQSMSFRWNASGGDSCKRFRSAAESLDGWCEAFKPWNFVTLDAMEFLESCKDQQGHGIYSDAPWPDDGDIYKHQFDEGKQCKLAKRLAEFPSARVVIRFGDHPLIRELYPETKWNWIRQTSRAQSNDEVNEVLILNGTTLA